MSDLNPKDHYKTPDKLTRRIDFIRRYATKNWFDWIADRVPAPDGKVLDIGCGPGWFWRRVADRWTPPHLTLGDISKGMLADAEARLGDIYSIDTVELDAVALPFADAEFDAVFAMHVLYHASDPHKALRDIARVTKPGGMVVVTTVNDDDLAMLSSLSRDIFGSAGADIILPVFGTARAKTLLSDVFDSYDQHSFCDTYHVDDPDIVLDYITSFPPGSTANDAARQAFRAAFEAARVEAGGTIAMDRKTDLFVALIPDPR